MEGLYITVVENGFIVNKLSTITRTIDKQWVFQDPESLSDFINHWGEEIKKTNEPRTT